MQIKRNLEQKRSSARKRKCMFRKYKKETDNKKGDRK